MIASPELQSAECYAEVQGDAFDFDAVCARYDTLGEALEAASSAAAALDVFTRWDELRRSLDTSSRLIELRFRQATNDPQHKAANESLNDLRPRLEGLDVAMKRRFLASPVRAALAEALGEHTLALWAADVTAFDPRVQTLAVRESGLQDEYTELMAGARFDFHGERLTLPTLGKYAENPDRELRREAAFVKWGFYADQRARLDRIFDDVVHVRDRMARELGFPNFVALGYRRLRRTDYGPDDVARYRETIVREIVPLARRIVEAQAREIGVGEVMLWDEQIFGTAPPPKPPAAYDEMLGAAERTFDVLGAEIGGLARLMAERELLDLRAREGKAGGGFCTSFPTYGLPYVFANFNGTTLDVNVLLHEMGHAFQCYASRGKPISDHLWATTEASEVHSMSMEFLAWPQLEQFFGAAAGRYRGQHLKSSILALPYAAAVDHFQHLVYEHPEASPAERHGFWRQLEATYLPWRRHGGIEHLENGGYWQMQRHIYLSPFYYIDYALAMCCALQFWSRSLDDHAGALSDYVALCKRGGELPFQALVRSAGLRSPFDEGVLRDVAQRAAAVIGV